MSLLVILIVSTSILAPLVEVIYKDREKDGSSIVSFLNQVCEVELEKYITNSYETLAEYVNAYDQKMFMKRENIRRSWHMDSKEKIYFKCMG